MAAELGSPNSPANAQFLPPTAAVPSWRWIVSWALLISIAIPAALLAATPIAAALLGLIDLGAKVGLWPGYQGDFLVGLGFLTALAFLVAAIQRYLLIRFIPRTGWLFAATIGGLFIGGLIAGIGILWVSSLNWDPAWGRVIIFLPLGLILGLAQWLVLRRILPNAFWIILIDMLAAGSILLAGPSFTSLFELVGILVLPGVVTGIGWWLLLGQPRTRWLSQPPEKLSKAPTRRLPRLAWIGLGLAAAIPLFFACIWVYAVSQLALAKNNGVYPTVEEAIIAHSQGWGGAKVVRIEDVHARPNRRNGSQPYLWFGGATIYLDRVPQGGNRSQYASGSYYIHVQDGWVFMSEGAFPEFIGWVMELYGLEGVHR
jgi:hypothetical protein